MTGRQMLHRTFCGSRIVRYLHLSLRADGFDMDTDLDALLLGHKAKAQAPPEGEGQPKNQKKGRLGEMADAADDELAKVEGP